MKYAIAKCLTLSGCMTPYNLMELTATHEIFALNSGQIAELEKFYLVSIVDPQDQFCSIVSLDKIKEES